MKRQHTRFYKRCYRHGFTLVEVVASLMLLGTLLVGMLTAHRRHVTQVRNAKARLVAITAAEKLLDKWRDEGTWGSTSSSGTFKDFKELVWRWSITTPVDLQRVGAAKGRLEIFRQGSADEPALIAIELVTGNAVIANGKGT